MVCIIPARGGSQRFPGKNTIEIGGKPIIEYVIRICLKTQLYRKVIVSTDSREIAAVASEFCAVSFRPEHLCGDSCETEVLKHEIDLQMEDYACRVYPFACLLTPERLCAGYYRFMNDRPDSVMECVKYAHPIQRAVDKITGEYIHPDLLMLRTQDLPPAYHDAGTFMYTTREALNKPLGERDIEWIERKEIEVQDVDTPEDFEMLKMKFKRAQNVNPL